MDEEIISVMVAAMFRGAPNWQFDGADAADARQEAVVILGALRRAGYQVVKGQTP